MAANIFKNVSASTTDSVVVPGVQNRVIRVFGLGVDAGSSATSVVFNSKGSGAGTPISMLMNLPAYGNFVLPQPANSTSRTVWFQALPGESLTVTTTAGSTVGIQLVFDIYSSIQTTSVLIPPVGTGYEAFILFDSADVRWAGATLTDGTLTTTITPTGPTNSLTTSPLLLQDTNNEYWILRVSTDGTLGAFQYITTSIVLRDELSQIWTISTDSGGGIITTLVGAVPASAFDSYPYPFVLKDSLGVYRQLNVDSSGGLSTATVTTPFFFFDNIILRDSSLNKFIFSVSPSDNIQTDATATVPTSYTSIDLVDGLSATHTMTISTTGNLITT